MQAEVAHRRVVRLVAAVAAAVLVSGCGTRLDDAEIVAAASKGGAVPGESASAAAGTGEQVAAGTPVDGAVGAPADAGVGTGSTPAFGASDRATGSGSTAAGAGTAARSQTPAAGGTRTQGPARAAAPSSGGGGTATAGATAPAPGATPGAPAATKSVVTIGNVGDYSGIVGSVLKEGGPMAQLVARYINDNGGLNGHPVKMLVGDGGGDPSRALSIVRDMVENKGVTAFMGNMWVLSGNGARAYLEEKQIPVIGGDVSTAAWFQSPMLFPQTSSFPTIVVGSAKSAVDAGKTKVAYIYCSEVEACKMWHDVGTARASEVGADVVYTAQISLAQPDFTAECLQAQRSGAEAVLLGMDSTALSRFMRSCQQQGYKPLPVLPSLAIISSTAKDPNLEGAYSPQSTFPFMATDVPATKEYHGAVARYAPNIEQSNTTSAVWVSGALLREVSKVLPDTPTSADFLKGLWQVKGNTLGGLAPPLTYQEGQPAPDIRCYFLQKIVSGKWTATQGTKQICL